MEDLDKIILEPDDGKILGVNITVDTIKERINALNGLEGDVLKKAMTQLKLALRANPEACNLLLPEDIGEMTKKIYEMNKIVMTQAIAKKAVSNSKKIDLKNLKEMPADF